MRALIINGKPDGGVNETRWSNAKATCVALGFECERSPAMYTSMDEYRDACGIHDGASNTEKYVRGCMFAHRKAFAEVAAGDAQVVILEDDVTVPTGELASTTARIHQFLDASAGADVSYIGHCFGAQCTHALALTPAGARKALEAVDWCGAKPVDNQLSALCANGRLKCSYAPTDKARADGSWGDGLLHQASGSEVRLNDWFP